MGTAQDSGGGAGPGGPRLCPRWLGSASGGQGEILGPNTLFKNKESDLEMDAVSQWGLGPDHSSPSMQVCGDPPTLWLSPQPPWGSTPTSAPKWGLWSFPSGHDVAELSGRLWREVPK